MHMVLEKVMSSSLWCIYFDPLLCKINSRELGYNIMHQHRPNIYVNSCQLASDCVGAVAFMDDIIWISETKDTLEENALNKITKVNAHPLPHFNDTFGGATWFTTMDLASGYWQVDMDLKDIEKIAF